MDFRIIEIYFLYMHSFFFPLVYKTYKLNKQTTVTDKNSLTQIVLYQCLKFQSILSNNIGDNFQKSLLLGKSGRKITA